MKTTALIVALFSALTSIAAQDAGQLRTRGRETSAKAQPSPSAALDTAWIDKLEWRSIGPANMGGRITSISVYEKDPSLFFASTASGGLLRTKNNGITFEHLFDREAVVSIGDVCVAQSDPDIVWVGTGEENPRNSVSYGNGVYKSVDGGDTWEQKGLDKSFQIGAVVVHPTDPDVVYVGALGRLYGPNEERGLYKTVDGGDTWSKILHVDDMTGVMEVKMHPTDPDTLLVASYERERDGFDGNPPAKKIAPGSALYRTVDGGESFEKLTEGLPTVTLGRIGVDYCKKAPNVVYACIETELIGKAGANVGWAGLDGRDAEIGTKIDWVNEEGPAAKAGVTTDDIVISVGGTTVLSNEQMQEQLAQHEAGATVAVEFARDGKSHVVDVTLTGRPEKDATRPRRGRRGGGNDDRPFGTRLGGQLANRTNQQGKHGYEHGGIYRSDDGGSSWRRVNSLHARPMYFSQIRVDPTDPETVYLLGVSASRSSDGGKTFTADASRGVHSDQHALWIDPNDGRHMVIGSDGGLYATYDQCAKWDHLNHMALGQFYHVAVGPRRDYWVYGGLQDNGTWGAPHRADRASGTINEDWIRIGGGDGFLVRVDENDPDQIYYSSQNGSTQRTHLKTMERGSLRPRAPEGESYRFNWETPFLLSHHNSRIYYSAGNHVFRSLDRGNRQKSISPEITRTDRGSATALTESPRDPDVLYVGTDDGAIWGTRNGGKDWTDLWVIHEEIAAAEAKPEASAVAVVEASLGGGEASGGPAGDGDDAQPVEVKAKKKQGSGRPLDELVPGPRWVSSLEASRFANGRCYVTLDAHRSDDDRPYVLVTEDFGETWRSLSDKLPWGSTRAIREDRVNQNVLYLGAEFGAWVSIDRGENWTRLNSNLPTVSVHDFAQHRSSGELVAATHGRSLWVLDVTPIRQMTAEVLAADAHLFEPNDVVVWRTKHRRAVSSGRRFLGQNPAGRAELFYSLGKKARSVSLEVQGLDGTTLSTIEAGADKGLHRFEWDLRRSSADANGNDPRSRFRRRPTVGAGTYVAVLTVDGQSQKQRFEVQRDPSFPETPTSARDEELYEDEDRGDRR